MTRLLAVFIAAAVIVATNANEWCGPGFRPRKESEGGGCILCTEKDRAATNKDGTPQYPEGEGQCAECAPGFTLEDRSEGASPSDSDSGCRPCTEKDREATNKDGTTPKYPECDDSPSPPECSLGFTPRKESEGGGCRLCEDKDREATNKDGTSKYPECDDSPSPPECGPGFRPRKESEGGGCILCTDKDREATKKDGTTLKYPECGDSPSPVECDPGFTPRKGGGCRECKQKDREATEKDGTTLKYPECSIVCDPSLRKTECRAQKGCVFDKGQRTCVVDLCAGRKNKGKCKKAGCKWSKKNGGICKTKTHKKTK